jgi:hypothetical protein
MGEIFLSYYWASFKKIGNDIFRFDTRVYLESIKKPSDKDICIGAVVGKNPGSAAPTQLSNNGLQKINLDGDQLLPNIKSIFEKSYNNANKNIRQNSYIQILNLMYICDKNLKQATNKAGKYSSQIICDTEKKHFPFLWYVWGGSNKELNIFKNRFSNLSANIHFYFDTKSKTIITTSPKEQDSARHTQGLKHDLVVSYISNIL